MKFLAIATLLAATSSLAHAALFDLTGATVSGTLELNGFTYQSGPLIIPENDGVVLDFNLRFDQGPDAPVFSIVLESSGSPYLFSDYQGVLVIGNTSATPFTFDSGLNLTITVLFATSNSPEQIGGFQFRDNPSLNSILENLTTQYDSLTGTLIIQSTGAIEIPDMTNLNIAGRFLTAPIPEPASTGLLTSLAVIGLLVVRRRPR